jgi:Ser/Thr protein kinase RdoA (MazF antagonist)
MQNACMMHLTSHGIASSPVMPSRSGDCIVELHARSGQTLMVRVLQWLDGEVLGNIQRCDAIYKSFGSFMGRVDNALTDFDHKEAHRKMAWDLANCKAAILGAIHNVQAEEKRMLIMHYVNLYDSMVSPKVPSLRQSVIHNDANDWNILGDPVSFTCTGIIDFGDTVYTHTVNNIAIGLAYQMLKQEDPVSVAAEIVTAYHSVFPLLEVEIEILFLLACMRLCVSAVLGAQAIALAPENEYLLLHSKPAWDTLNQLHSINHEIVVSRLKTSTQCGASS